MTINLNPDERLDDLQRNGYKLIQNTKIFCFGMDAVLLCAFTKVEQGDRVLDLGTGNGVIPILLKGRTEGEAILFEYDTLSNGYILQPFAIRKRRRPYMRHRISNKFGYQRSRKCVVADSSDLRKRDHAAAEAL